MGLFEEMKRKIEHLKQYRVSDGVSKKYISKLSILVNFVDEKMNNHPDLESLIGSNHHRVMWDNHKNHASFMASVFKFDLYELLFSTIPWVYRSYHSHGFSYDYFILVLHYWKEAVNKYLALDEASQIIKIYDWLIENHENMIAMSKCSMDFIYQVPDKWLPVKSKFMSALLQGEHKKCLDIQTDNVKDHYGLEQFYLNVLQASLYDIGNMWENNLLTVAEEHMASSIIARLMAEAYSSISKDKKPTKGRAIVTSAPYEFHQLGAWMVSDLLESDGWKVKYLGANMPHKDLIQTISTYKPDIIAISVTMAYNIAYVAETIREIKATPEFRHIKVIVGGLPINLNKDIYKRLEADGTAADAKKAVDLANSLITVK